LTPAKELRARHILVPTEEEAKAIIADLDKGGDFEAIAKEKSQDGAAANGGDLGYFGAGQMVPEFEEAAFAINVGISLLGLSSSRAQQRLERSENDETLAAQERSGALAAEFSPVSAAR
jgi:hypothetical protein